MYHFKDKDGKEFKTKFSPLEISDCILFDAYDNEGNFYVIDETKVNYQSFYYV